MVGLIFSPCGEEFLNIENKNQLMIGLNGNYGNIKGSYIPILYPNRRIKVYVQNSKIQYIIQTSLWQ